MTTPADRAVKSRVFVDMDGVIVDFDAYRAAHGLTGDEVKRQPGAYLAMPAIPGAIESVRSLIGMGYEVWIATKPPTGVPYAYSDKAAWVFEHIPELKRRIIITHDKGLLGGPGDFLLDDRPHKANCERFTGTLLRFVDGYHWPQALEFFRARAREIDAASPAPAAVPDGSRAVPLELLHRVADSLGRFVGDEGWCMADMGTFDDLSALVDAAPTPPATEPEPEPEIHSFDPTEYRRTVTVRWPDGKCLHYTLSRDHYTDNLPPDEFVTLDEIVAGLNISPEEMAEATKRVKEYIATLPPATAQKDTEQ